MLKKIKLCLILIVAHLLALAIKLRGKSSGTSFVGMILLKLSPNYLRDASKYVKNYITVTGTNGKTTTAGILTHILKGNYKTLSNSKGANMLTGIANAFALSSIPFKEYDYAVLEADEAYLSRIYNYITADYLVVTNLFRDQLDRYGELSTTAAKIQQAIDKNKSLQLILNADDPLVVGFNTNGDKAPIYYGFENISYASGASVQANTPMEMILCPNCGKNLEYDKIFYAQQGHYYCECGYKRPNTKYPASVVIYDTYSEISINVNGESRLYRVPLIGLYNAYNALGAIVASLEIGVENIQQTLDTFKTEFGRGDVHVVNGKTAIIQLIKNPTGAGEVLKTINKDSNIMIALNDNYGDGRDVSWLWDTDFEILKDCKQTVVASGLRAQDMAVRLKYAGVPNIKVIPNIDEALKFVINDKSTDKVTILPSYTAMLEINQSKEIKG